MGDQLTVQAGSDATRLNLDPAEAAIRRRKQAVARGNLAALMCERYGVDPSVEPHPTTLAEQLAAREFADVADILGLDPARKTSTGTCRRCGGSRPLASRQSGGGGGGLGGYKPGLCWWCSNGRERPADAQPAVQYHTDPTPVAHGGYHGGTGHCPECGRGYHLNGQGHLRTHPAWEDRDGTHIRLTTPCPGSGELARELADLTEAVSHA